MMSTSTSSGPPPASARARSAHDQGSVKETLESILVAFILAFIFRAFVVEAFVIPTGSMAPTLLGAHLRFRCTDCGWRFETNYTAPQTADGDLVIGSTSANIHNVECPNCGFRVPLSDADEPDNDATHPSIHYGDRILVLKYLYLFEEPQRWDVVVFKSPDREPNGGEPTYTQNYIKRLIGKPGEMVMILDGDIYIGKPGDKPEDYVIQTKPRYAQSALWRIIYDNDFYPQGLERSRGPAQWKQPWTASSGTGWNLGERPADGRIFHFENAAGGSELTFDQAANSVRPLERHAFTDWLAYDAEAPPWNLNNVHELKVSFYYQRKAGDGPLHVTLGDGARRFAAVLTPDQARLVELTDAGEVALSEPVHLKAGDDPVHVEFSNVDYQVTLRVNDAQVAQTTPQQYHPDIPALLRAYHGKEPRPRPSAQISAERQTCAISHLSIWRDVYYLNRTYITLSGTPDNPTNLGPDEYFVLGDNSPVSADARYWSKPIDLPADRLVVAAGRVPGRFMLGRAFFVYWPAGFRPGLSWMPAIAPDFGDMRYIR